MLSEICLTKTEWDSSLRYINMVQPIQINAWNTLHQQNEEKSYHLYIGKVLIKFSYITSTL